MQKQAIAIEIHSEQGGKVMERLEFTTHRKVFTRPISWDEHMENRATRHENE
jgi:hypothetical protein